MQVANALDTPTSIAGVFSLTFALPFVGIGLVLLAFGIAWVRTHKIHISFYAGFIVGLVLFFISNSLIASTTLIIMGVLVFGLVLLEQFIGRRK